MSNFPNQLDNDVTLPPVNDNITEIGGDAINALRDAVLNLEEEVGVGASSSTRGSGNVGSIAARIGVSIDPDGYIKPSALVDIGLVALPIYDGYIAPNAQIKESKLALDHNTQDLFNNILGLSGEVNVALGWINSTGIKLLPHIDGIAYRHELAHIEVSYDPNKYFKNRFDLNQPKFALVSQTQFRNNADAYTMLNDLNIDYVIHQKSDGTVYDTVKDIVTVDGLGTYPSNYAHTASGIYLSSSGYTLIPPTVTDVQSLANFIDSNSIFLLGTRIQNLYSNGISRASRSNAFGLDGYGTNVVPVTKVTTYLLNAGNYPNDNPGTGDDIILFTPETSVTSTFEFDSQFSAVKVGDIIRVNYGTVVTEFLVKEKKYVPGSPSTFAIRIDGKNLLATTDGYARIDKPLFNPNKYGVLSVAPAQVLSSAGINEITGVTPSLIVSHPRGAVALGNGFDPSQIDGTCYNLWLVLYPDGNPANGSISMLPIDITGNQGTTPGAYTLDLIIENVNNAVRKRGYNYRFAAFKYNGQFGIMLTDSYNNAGFSIIAGLIDSGGTQYDTSASQTSYPYNVIRYDVSGSVTKDPLGLSFIKANIATPPYVSSYSSAGRAYAFPTKVFLPLKRNNYYVNGSEKDNFASEIYQLIDSYGDGYWIGTVVAGSKVISYGVTGRVQLTYRINHDLSTSSLTEGKTLVVQRLSEGNNIDYGRYVISDVQFTPDLCSPSGFYTDITVFDSIQGNPFTNGINPPAVIPSDSAADGYQYALYFNSDSVTFNNTNSFDSSVSSNYKRHFEIYTDPAGKTFSLERGRMNILGSPFGITGGTTLFSDSELAKINIQRISPKLRGYTNGITSVIVLNLTYDPTYDTFTGRLMKDNLGNNAGPLTSGKKGEVIRFYDETNIDYIDFIFDINDTISTITNKYISIQLFSTLSQDEEVFLLSSCQLNDITRIVTNFVDLRQFGNISEKDLSTSVFNYMSTPERLIHANGVVRGFDIPSTVGSTDSSIYLLGGVALVNGKFIQLNNTTINIPPVMEFDPSTPYEINWVLCANDNNEFELFPLLDNNYSLPTDRILIALDVTSNNTYQLDALTFEQLINTRKDLTPLYNVVATITGPTPVYSNVTVTDIRKFINDEPINNTFTWSDSDNNIPSYFHSSESVLFWGKYYKGVTNTFKIRGTASVSGDFDLSSIDSNIVFEGDSLDATINIDGNLILPVNYKVTFKNLTVYMNGSSRSISSSPINTEKLTLINVKINGSSSPLSSIQFGNAILQDVEVLIDTDSLIIGNNSEVSNCSFLNCGSITINDYLTLNNCSFGNTTVGNLNIGNNVIINNSSFGNVSAGSLEIKDNSLINICLFASGGTVANGITVGVKSKINNCIFGASGGAVEIKVNASMENNTFGAITGALTIRSNSLFNHVTFNGCTSNLTIESYSEYNYCTFGNVSAGNVIVGTIVNMDGCSIGNISGTLTIGNQSIINNSTFGTTGGTITVNSNASMQNNTFGNCSGSLVIGSYSILNGCNFGNFASGVISTNIYAVISGCVFANSGVINSGVSIGNNNIINNSKFAFNGNINGSINFGNNVSMENNSFGDCSGGLSIQGLSTFNACIFGDFTSKISINSYNILNGCVFGSVTVTSGLNPGINVSSNNIFNNCSFANISSSTSVGMRIASNNNSFNNCSFANISSTTANGIFISGNYNNINFCNFDDVSSATTSNINTLYITGNNCVIENTEINSIINNSNTTTSAALYATNAVKINKLKINSIQSKYNCTRFFGVIKNSNFGTLQAENGIQLISNSIFKNNTFTYQTTKATVTGIGAINGGIIISGNNITIDNCLIENDSSTLSPTGNAPPTIGCYFSSSGSTVENIYITNNKFTASNNLDETIAAIAFIENGSGTDPNVIDNIFIENNTAKAMSAYITGRSSSNTLIAPGIKSLNTNIIGNSFYRLGLGVTSGGNAAPYTLEREKLTISNNNIDIIDSVDLNKVDATNSNIGTGNVLISNNNLSYMKYLYQNDQVVSMTYGYYTSSLTIDKNTFECNSISGYTDAIYLSNFKSSSILDVPCRITNNIIRSKTSTYGSGINIPENGTEYIHCNIIGNFITGFTNYGIYCATYGTKQTIITDNNISRGSFNITAYISGSTASTSNRYALVVDNVLDRETVNGTSTDVIINRGDNWIVERNINQTETFDITGNIGNLSVYGDASGPISTNGIVAGYDSSRMPDGCAIGYQNDASPATELFVYYKHNAAFDHVTYTWSINPEQFLSHGIKINSLATSVVAGSSVSTSIAVLDIIKNGVVINTSGSISISTAGTYSVSIPSTSVMIDYPDSIQIRFKIYVNKSTAGSGGFTLSPINISYRW